MTIFAEKCRMNLAFNKILKKDLELVIPFIQELGEYKTDVALLRARLAEMFDQNYECFGVYLHGEVIGVFGLWFMTRHYAGKSCEPDHVFIKTEYQNKGLGKQIFEFIFQYAEDKGCETAELNSYVHNFRSHKFYMNHGFVIKGYHFLKKL
ncbi:GNAT family N-acetyltransferase [Antarcticibacterium flavum]|uniref:GNAT family N-acetyltransferase n=1 Tax=Antarcticibacterium flavum TaxID=2058175 RepID=A0A5B7X6K4_9FLAO|nr:MULTISPECIES: GNAT family N-acetyltransferase [Antarcticibacterium]MCM4160042.1 GNAT family N-acetyltransferase [Antarcticibacterium sp. W02-3]QCY70372.1 GNAT family N-acetyltransferase [Antarcticibacterium flavum]